MPEPTKPLSPRPSRDLCLGSALLAVVISTLVHLLSPPPQPAPSPRFSVIIDAGSTGTRAHVFSLGPDGRPDLACSAVMRVSPGLSSFAADTARAAESLRPLNEFAKEKVGGEGAVAATEVWLMATVGLRLLEESVREAILVSCRNALRASGFRFEDSWAKVIPGSDEGVYAWVAANYALGTLGMLNDEDFSRYCFSSAYIVALLHDSLGVPLDDKRILGASGAAAAPTHKHRPLLVVLGAFLTCGVFLVLRWRKPKTRIIYDLEKGRYIITRIS
ncbi:probable apyrase 6 [Hordeum vulgare subsp. vulgare]|uniref:probable apyrase 6 n=1 Tax=Hordeum vulgare subsp. vulgare TaxID=112509 RepID=UPI001D1A37C0|nr:probable apyrase 6 [Hordeum vulgare subsp. vulgare]